MRLTASGDGLEPIERVLPKLQRVKKCGKGWAARCPAHKDKRPSMTVAIGKDGRVLLNCHKGCSYKDIMTAIGLQESDGFPAEAPVPQAEERPRAIVKTYDYRDEQGKVLFQTVRYAPKDFRQRHQNGNSEWLWNLEDVRRVLYRLPEVLAADPNVMVWLVEGEKDADYLASLGFLATTSPMGAKSWRAEYAEFLRGRHVVIVPDNDVTGHEYAGKVFASLQGTAASIKVLLLPELKPSGDVSDWLDAGHTADELAALAEETEETEDASDFNPRYTLHWLSEVDEEDEPVEWVVDELFQRGSICLLHGAPGTKKTYTLLDLSMCLLMGKPWLGRDTTQGTVLLIDEESGPKRLKRRLRECKGGHDIPSSAPLAYTTLEMFNLLSSKTDMEHIDNLLAETRPTLVIVDALADIMPGGDENEVKDTHPVFQKLKYLAHKHNCCIIVIHHSNRTGSYRGSSAIPGVIDVMIKLESKPRSSELFFTVEKNRDGEESQFGADIQFNKDTKTVRIVSSLVAEPETRQRASVQHVLEYLRRAGGGAFVDDITAAPAICSPAAARQAIYALARDKRIKRTDNGTRGTRAFYKLADSVDSSCEVVMSCKTRDAITAEKFL